MRKPTLSLRDISVEDAASINRYWADNTADDLIRLGEEARPDAQGNVDFITQLCSERPAPDRAEEGILIWEMDGMAVGYSTLKEIRYGVDAQIHLHMWERDLRGKGTGAVFFVLSALRFIKDFQLGMLYCQPNYANPMPNRMLKKLGCTLMGEVDWKQPRSGSVVRQNRYSVNANVLYRYLDSVEHLFSFQRH